MDALTKLSEDYLSSSSDNEENNASVKRKAASNSPKNVKKVCTVHKTANSEDEKYRFSSQLPVPTELLSMFETLPDCDEPVDNPSDHEGRLRSFSHERGNWATHIYIPSSIDEVFSELIEHILSKCKDLTRTKELHISLSKTVVLKYHWISPFIESLRKRMEGFRKTTIFFDAIALYLNEEKSRTFLSLKVNTDDFLNQLTEKINETLEEFHLPTFYEKPSFHLTIGWCLGNKLHELNNTLPIFEELFSAYCEEARRSPYIKVDAIWCKTGHKMFSFPLL